MNKQALCRMLLLTVTAIVGIWSVVSHVAAQSISRQATRTVTFSSISQTPTKPPETLVLGEKAVLGKVTFSHLNHTTKNFDIGGIRPVYCIECHHVEQPEAEAKKMLPHQTAYPANRTTTLTADLIAKEPNTKVTPCRSCHARKEEKPTLWPQIPEIKSEDSTAIITVTNQQAFHRACAGCHDQAAKARPDVKAPTSKKCTACHKKSAA
ncbi:MAG TPA: cytochrome c3 family protein [Pyrinomonadaceae bacterium]